MCQRVSVEYLKSLESCLVRLQGRLKLTPSFHFISATWRNDDGLRIPRTVDFSCLTEKLLGRSMGIAYVSPHMHVSTHASVGRSCGRITNGAALFVSGDI